MLWYTDNLNSRMEIVVCGLFIHSPIEGCLGSFQVLAIMNNIKTCVQMFVWQFSVLLGKYQRAQLIDYMVRMCLVLKEIAKLSSKVLYHLHSCQQMTVSLFPQPIQHLMLLLSWILGILIGG